jgi:hypothetical protein
MPTFEGLVLGPTKRPQNTLNSQSTAVNRQCKVLPGTVNFPSLAHSLDPGAEILLRSENHVIDQPFLSQGAFARPANR